MSVVTLSVNNSTRGAVAGGGTYDNGTQITVTATANSGSLFACWSIGEVVVSSNPSYTFSVSGNVTLTAHFYNDIDGAKIYGLCGANGKHRVLNIGQVISLIQEMAANDWKVPTGYIPKTAVNSIVEQSTGKELKFFINTQKVWADYKGDKTDMLFLPTDDTTLTELQKTINGFISGEVSVENAMTANAADRISNRASFIVKLTDDNLTVSALSTSSTGIDLVMSNKGYKRKFTIDLGSMLDRGVYSVQLYYYAMGDNPICTVNLLYGGGNGALARNTPYGFVHAEIFDDISKNKFIGHYFRLEKNLTDKSTRLIVYSENDGSYGEHKFIQSGTNAMAQTKVIVTKIQELPEL